MCRSEVLEFIGETITRVTWLIFLYGVNVPFTAEFNRRSQTATFEVAGKLVSQWSCEDPARSDSLPYTLTKQNQKFVLNWLVTSDKETFELQVNGQNLSVYTYLDSSFQLVDDQI